MMRRLLAAALLSALLVGPGASASTPDDAWVAKFAARIADPAVYDVKPRTVVRYFDGVLHLHAVGDASCPRSFEATDKWPTLTFSWFSFAEAKTCDSSPLGNVKIDLSGDNAPEVAPMLEALGRRLGKPTIERVNRQTNVAEATWGDRHHGVGIDYDAGNPRGFTIWVFGPGSTERS